MTLCLWRDVRVADGARLESVCAVIGTKGSNPFLSARSDGSHHSSLFYLKNYALILKSS